jgi:O-antigen ligase
MQRKEFHIKAHAYLSMAIAFCLPFGRPAPIFIVLLFLNWLAEGDLKNKFRLAGRNKWFWLFISLYLIHISGMAFTEYVDLGLFDLEVKLSILLFPIIFISRPLSAQKINNVLKAFVAGGVLSSVFLLIRATWYLFSSGENKFIYEAFSVLVHTSYVSMYFNFLMAWIILGLLKKGNIRASYSLPLSWFLVFFFMVVNILFSSKMGVVSMIIMFLSFGAYYVKISRRYIAGGIVVVLFSGGLLLAVKTIPEIQSRVHYALAAFGKKDIDITSNESSEVRRLVWRAANEIIAGNFITGVGTGDAKPMLLRTYAKHGMLGAFEHRLNAHNEFYQIFVALGLIGFVILLACLILPLIKAFRERFLLYLIFISFIILNFLVESMLETQAGVIYFAFVNSMLFFHIHSAEDPMIENNLSKDRI